jgi:hypothetical protein
MFKYVDFLVSLLDKVRNELFKELYFSHKEEDLGFNI